MVGQGVLRECLLDSDVRRVLSVTTRVHVTWEGDNALKVEMDAGKQTRMFNFGAPKSAVGEATLQGISWAQ